MGAQRCRRATRSVIEGVQGVCLVIAGTLALLMLAYLGEVEDSGVFWADL